MATFDDLYDELKKYGIEELHNFLSERKITSSMVWNLTKQETKDELGMAFGQEKMYWEARGHKELESGRYGNHPRYIHTRAQECRCQYYDHLPNPILSTI